MKRKGETKEDNFPKTIHGTNLHPATKDIDGKQGTARRGETTRTGQKQALVTHALFPSFTTLPLLSYFQIQFHNFLFFFLISRFAWIDFCLLFSFFLSFFLFWFVRLTATAAFFLRLHLTIQRYGEAEFKLFFSFETKRPAKRSTPILTLNTFIFLFRLWVLIPYNFIALYLIHIHIHIYPRNFTYTHLHDHIRPHPIPEIKLVERERKSENKKNELTYKRSRSREYSQVKRYRQTIQTIKGRKQFRYFLLL